MPQGKSALGLVCSLIVLPAGLSLPASATTYSVIDYGAVPDDGGDDLAGITAAVSAASGGDTVYFPGGTYRISGSVTARSGIRLEGAAGAVLLYDTATEGVILAMYGTSNATVTGLTLDGNNATAATQGVAGSDASGITLENLTIRNLANTTTWGPHGILFDPNLVDSTIRNNTITNIGTGSAWGAGIRLGHGSSRNLVEGNTIANTGRGGILCNDNSTDLVIRNNTVTGSGLTTEGLGIELWGGCHRGLVEDNHIDHWLSLCTSSYCAVRRNTVSDHSGAYMLCGLEWVDAQFNVFVDNLVDGGAQIGISLSGDGAKEYGLWARNSIQSCGSLGAQLMGQANGCSYMYFYQNTFQHTNGTQPPAMYPGMGDGFRFNGNCHYISLEANELSYNDRDGIVGYAGNLDQMSFTNNVIINNLNGGMWDNYGADLESSGNTIYGNYGGSPDHNAQLTSRGFANQKPAASFDCPTAVTPGEVVSFTNTSTDPDGSIGHLLWDFGDGVPSTETSPTHAYARAGSYIVTLVVWDDQGRGSLAARTISVEAGTATPTPTDSPAPTDTPIPTETPSPSPTAGNTDTPTATPTAISSNTPMDTSTPTASATGTTGPTATATRTPSSTPTRTRTPTATAVLPATATPTATAMPTAIPSDTPPTATLAATETPTPTSAPGGTNTPEASPTASPTVTETATATMTATDTAAPTIPATNTPTGTHTPVPPTATVAATASRTPTFTPTATPSPSPTAEPSAPPSATLTPTASATASSTPRATPTLRASVTPTNPPPTGATPAVADRDGDGVADAADNCSDIPNADQRDSNQDGVGDACDSAAPASGGCAPCSAAPALMGMGLALHTLYRRQTRRICR